MKNLEQQGVRKKWTTDRKRIRNNGIDWVSSFDERNTLKLRRYAERKNGNGKTGTDHDSFDG